MDVLRGLAVAGMIVATSPGDWSKAYWPLKHADWNGWTPTDIVFPTFLFSVGVAVGLSFPKPLGESSVRAGMWLRVGRRVASLLALGLVLNWLYTAATHFGLPSPHPYAWAEFRIPGVPQRIALCYLVTVGLITQRLYHSTLTGISRSLMNYAKELRISAVTVQIHGPSVRITGSSKAERQSRAALDQFGSD